MGEKRTSVNLEMSWKKSTKNDYMQSVHWGTLFKAFSVVAWEVYTKCPCWIWNYDGCFGENNLYNDLNC